MCGSTREDKSTVTVAEEEMGGNPDCHRCKKLGQVTQLENVTGTGSPIPLGIGRVLLVFQSCGSQHLIFPHQAGPIYKKGLHGVETGYFIPALAGVTGPNEAK